MIRLLERQVASLVAQRETGMGYQRVSVERDSGTQTQGTVYNCEYLEEGSGVRTAATKDGYRRLFASATFTGAGSIRSIRVIRPLAGARTLKEARTSGGPASEASLQNTLAAMVFARFCAYEKDRRITNEGGLVPGTYATTMRDAETLRTGSEAVERYALPDPTPAKFRFRIDPLAGTPYRQGTVQPAFGHAGGGVEVTFDEGTDPGSVTGPKELPER